MKSDYTTNSCYITHTIALWKVGRIHFLSSGVKGLKNELIWANCPGLKKLNQRPKIIEPQHDTLSYHLQNRSSWLPSSQKWNLPIQQHQQAAQKRKRNKTQPLNWNRDPAPAPNHQPRTTAACQSRNSAKKNKKQQTMLSTLCSEVQKTASHWKLQQWVWLWPRPPGRRSVTSSRSQPISTDCGTWVGHSCRTWGSCHQGVVSVE